MSPVFDETTLWEPLSALASSPLSSSVLQKSHWIHKGLTEDFHQCTRRLHCSCCKIDPRARAAPHVYPTWNHQNSVKRYSTNRPFRVRKRDETRPERMIIETAYRGILNFSSSKHCFLFKSSARDRAWYVYRELNIHFNFHFIQLRNRYRWWRGVIADCSLVHPQTSAKNTKLETNIRAKTNIRAFVQSAQSKINLNYAETRGRQMWKAHVRFVYIYKNNRNYFAQMAHWLTDEAERENESCFYFSSRMRERTVCPIHKTRTIFR